MRKGVYNHVEFNVRKFYKPCLAFDRGLVNFATRSVRKASKEKWRNILIGDDGLQMEHRGAASDRQ